MTHIYYYINVSRVFLTDYIALVKKSVLTVNMAAD